MVIRTHAQPQSWASRGPPSKNSAVASASARIAESATAHVAATWAIAPSAMRADAIATALFFDGGPQLAHEWGVDWVRMATDGRVEWSPGSRAELFTRPASVEG